MREPRESLHFAAPVAATAGAATVPTGAEKIADATPFAHTWRRSDSTMLHVFSTIPALKIKQRCTDGFGSDTHRYEFGCHYLPHFISNSDSHSNTYSIYNIDMDGNGQGRVRLKYLPARWHTRLSLLYPYPPNVTGKNPYPYPYPQGKRYPMFININMSLSSYLRVQ
jgi:hypothetical protein